MALRSQLFKAVNQATGSYFVIKKTITSSGLLTTAQDLTTVANRGELEVVQIIVKTDSTGLAGATNLEILSNNAKGQVNIAVAAVSGLGASKTKVMVGGSDDSTTDDNFFEITGRGTVLEAGKKLQYIGTGSAGTGAGTIDVYVMFRRLSDGATCTVA